MQTIERMMAIEAIEPYAPKPRFHVDEKGVYHIAVKTDKDGNTQEQPPLLLSDCIDLIGNGFNEAGEAFRIIRYTSKQTRQKAVFALSCAQIGYNWQTLQGKGITIFSGRAKRELLADYLQTQGSFEQWRVSDKAGWHNGAYILPNGEIIGQTQQQTIYNGDTSRAHAYAVAGSLHEWQEHIARYAQGNSRLCLALGTALAAPLLALLKEHSGGFHLYGDSSDGKTTAAMFALSVWGQPESLKMQWNGTGLGFANLALSRNDNLLVLDEIGEASAKVVSQTAYSVINGKIKVQGKADGGNRPEKSWNVLLLSTGEHPLSSYMKMHGEQWQAGQAVRMPSIAAATLHGIYDELHGFKNGAALSDHLLTAMQQYHGIAGREWIKQLAQTPAETIRQERNQFMSRLPENLDGQALRVARRFALCAAALELATNITGLAAGVGVNGVLQCFKDWYKEHGIMKHEDAAIIEAMADFMIAYAHTPRFTYWGAGREEHALNHAGYKKDGEYWIIPPVFKTEILKGSNPAKGCKVLHEVGYIKKAANGYQFQKTGGGRYYVATGIEPVPAK